jgi:hypothetical protein
MIDIIIALTLAGLTAVWRFADGRSQNDLAPNDMQCIYRPRHSNVYAAALVLSAIAWPTLSPDRFPPLAQILSIVLSGAVVLWCLLKGMPGFDRWLPHVNSKGKRLSGMLIGYALPPALCGVVSTLLFGPSLGYLAFGISGLLPSATYVLGSQLEERRKNSGYPSGGQFLIRGRYWSGEELGRLSMSALIFPIPLF